jgi:hypothetical protein
VATAQVDHVSCHQVALETVLSDQRQIVADEQQANRAAPSLNDGVGGQRRRKGHQVHLSGGHGLSIKDRGHSLPNPNRQVVTGGQGLGPGQHFTAGVIHQHGIGIRAAGINAQGNRHVSSSR